MSSQLPLQRVRVLTRSSSTTGGYAGRLLADRAHECLTAERLPDRAERQVIGTHPVAV